eukprot:gene10743-1952_t
MHVLYRHGLRQGGDCRSYELSALPSRVFPRNLGNSVITTNATMNQGYVTFSIARPCGSVGDGVNDRCVARPTSDPFAMNDLSPGGEAPATPLCTGLGEGRVYQISTPYSQPLPLQPDG